MKFNIVRITESHLESTAALEALCFSHPWTKKGLRTLLGDSAVGFAVLDEAEKNVISDAGMIIAADTGDITDVATHPLYRRMGLGRAVIEKLIEFSKKQRLSCIALEVRASNTPAIKLYESLGFVIEGKRPRFYRDPPEDAFVMVKQL